MMIAFYFSRDLIELNRGLWTNMKINILNRVSKDLNAVGILVDYDLHPELQDRVSCFGKCFFVQNFFKIQKGKHKKI